MLFPARHFISNILYDQLATKRILRPQSIHFCPKKFLYNYFFFDSVTHCFSKCHFKDHLGLFHRKTYCYKKLLCISLRSAMSPNILRSVCCKTKRMASVKSRLICFPPVKVRCRDFCLEPLRSNSSRSHSEVHKAS